MLKRSRRNFIKLMNGVKKMEIKVLGPGCAKCQKTEKLVKEAVAEAGITATVEKVTDIMKIAGYGVMGTPAVVVDGDVKSVGKIPSKEDIKSWLEK
jgi:small redox-active disulfide protein 2